MPPLFYDTKDELSKKQCKIHTDRGSSSTRFFVADHFLFVWNLMHRRMTRSNYKCRFFLYVCFWVFCIPRWKAENFQLREKRKKLSFCLAWLSVVGGFVNNSRTNFLNVSLVLDSNRTFSSPIKKNNFISQLVCD